MLYEVITPFAARGRQPTGLKKIHKKQVGYAVNGCFGGVAAFTAAFKKCFSGCLGFVCLLWAVNLTRHLVCELDLCFVDRITSYNVCYTKLLRSRGRKAMGSKSFGYDSPAAED